MRAGERHLPAVNSGVTLRRHACLLLALALASVACSGPTRGGGEAVSGESTSTSQVRSFHDPLPIADAGVPAGTGGSVADSGPRQSSGNSGGSTATTVQGGFVSTSTTALRTSSSTTTTPTTVPPGLPPEKCPDAKTCRRYAFSGGAPAHWRTGTDGRVTIPYRINPTGANPITPEQIEGAMRAAFDTWERAAPALRFVYEGRTSLSGAQGDGVNVISFNGPTAENTGVRTDAEGYIVEFDMLYGPNGWTWAPCQQADGACSPHDTKDATGQHLGDLQSIATHAAGHALMLRDMTDVDLDRELTMYPNVGSYPPGARQWSTLALGDVLGVRALYPCSCPLPPIYSP